MASVDDLVAKMRTSHQNIRYEDLCKVCTHYFGEARQKASSHAMFRTPWLGDPRVNIQNDHGKAKAYQVKQVVRALDRLEAEQETTG